MKFLTNIVSTLSVLKIKNKVTLDNDVVRFCTHNSHMRFKFYTHASILDKNNKNDYYIKIVMISQDKNHTKKYEICQIDPSTLVNKTKNNVHVYNIKYRLPSGIGRNYKRFDICSKLYCRENPTKTKIECTFNIHKIEFYTGGFFEFKMNRFPYYKLLQNGIQSIDNIESKVYKPTNQINYSINTLDKLTHNSRYFHLANSDKEIIEQYNVIQFYSYMDCMKYEDKFDKLKNMEKLLSKRKYSKIIDICSNEIDFTHEMKFTTIYHISTSIIKYKKTFKQIFGNKLTKYLTEYTNDNIHHFSGLDIAIRNTCIYLQQEREEIKWNVMVVNIGHLLNIMSLNNQISDDNIFKWIQFLEYVFMYDMGEKEYG